MTREIKFRGKAADVEQPSSGKMHKAGEWVYGNLCGHPDRIEIEEMIRMSSKYWHIPSTIIDPNTVGQYTGLHDKNGKEIYEGDFVRFHMHERGIHESEYQTGLVEFGGGRFYAYLDCSTLYFCGDSEDYEVIGNIYDNPELLKEKDDNEEDIDDPRLTEKQKKELGYK